MPRRKYQPRKMTQAAAVVKLRTYVDKSKYSAGIVSKCDPKEPSEYTNFTLRIGDGADAFSVVSKESFDDAFDKLDKEFERLGLVKGTV